VIPLAHAFQTLVGAGQVLGPDGEPRDAGATLAARGAAPHRLRAKEGIALLAGAPMAAATALARLRAAERLADQLLAAAAASIDALQAPQDPYDAAVGELAGDAVLAAVLAPPAPGAGGLRGAAGVAGAGVVPGDAAGACPARADPRPAGRGRPAGAGRRDRLPRRGRRPGGGRRRLPRPRPGGGHGHAGGGAGAGRRAGRPAAAPAAGRPLQRPAGPAHPHARAARRVGGGPQAGRGALNEARRLAAPASVGLADTSLGQEDATTFAPEAAEKLRQVEELARELAVCELLAARQTWWLRRAEPPTGLRDLGARLAALVAPVDQDRPLGQDLAGLVAALERGELRLP
jgi:histidine ammonia-lyase